MKLFTPIGLLGIVAMPLPRLAADVVAEQATCATDPATCRMVVTSNNVYALTTSSLYDGVVMRYDLEMDPLYQNKANAWNRGADIYGKTAYDYTKENGPLGLAGPMGYSGPLGSLGALPKRFHGTVSPNDSKSYWNNWCDVDATDDDEACVYGSWGPLVRDELS